MDTSLGYFLRKCLGYFMTNAPLEWLIPMPKICEWPSHPLPVAIAIQGHEYVYTHVKSTHTLTFSHWTFYYTEKIKFEDTFSNPIGLSQEPMTQY